MIIVGLLIVALVCLALGLILPSTAWLIASLIASVGAGYVLFRARTLIAGAHTADATGGAASTGAAATAVLDREPAAEAEAEPRRTRAQSRAEARAAKAAAAEEAREAAEEARAAEHGSGPAEELVAEHDAYEAPTQLIEPVPASGDGYPTEVSGGELLAGVTDDATAAESESGSDESSSEPALEANEGDVWVIDGRPRYHLATCAIIQGQDAEPIPFEQATEDGFMPCSLCEPNVVRATA